MAGIAVASGSLEVGGAVTSFFNPAIATGRHVQIDSDLGSDSHGSRVITLHGS